MYVPTHIWCTFVHISDVPIYTYMMYLCTHIWCTYVHLSDVPMYTCLTYVHISDICTHVRHSHVSYSHVFYPHVWQTLSQCPYPWLSHVQKYVHTFLANIASHEFFKHKGTPIMLKQALCILGNGICWTFEQSMTIGNCYKVLHVLHSIVIDTRM
jgi:hypothetical protein